MMTLTFRKCFTLGGMIACMIHVANCLGGGSEKRMPKHEIELKGQAAGGEILLFDVSARSGGGMECDSVRVDTTRGESAQSVARRLVAATIATQCWTGIGFRHQGESGLVTGLEGYPGFFALAGSEVELGIPLAPESLSGVYDPQRRRVTLRWENPVDGYDAISDGITLQRYPSNQTVMVVQTGDLPQPYPFMIVGTRKATPSNASIINVSSTSQEELASVPFFGGVAPNWRKWQTQSDGRGEVVFQQATRGTRNKRWNETSPEDKFFYQIVATRTAQVKAGICRKWLGLTPGHKYRVSVRLNTLAMDQSPNSWALSFHVAANAPGGAAFTSEQLAGQAPLPEGAQGVNTAQMIAYGPGKTTKGGWVCSTMEITLPPQVDTITTWLRHNGQDSTGIGMDWIKVEDLSASK